MALASDLARRAGARAISVDYRLAPENPYPAGLDDAVTASTALVSQRPPTTRVVIAGESAGGGLAAATLLALRDARMPPPSAAFLMSPWVDLAVSGESITTKAAVDPALTPDGLRRGAGDYTTGADLAEPLVSPFSETSRACRCC